jgi:quinoprotein glucose dehydrogenase
MPHWLKRAEGADAPYAYYGNIYNYLGGPRGLPLTKPPYGRITAIDLNTGEHAWMKPVGSGPRDHPALSELALPPLGWRGASSCC